MFSTITTGPAKQSVSETISVLSGRLSSATLLEDRRAAILGLRSFAKDYPASVASGALRSLIESLDKDGEDVDTVKVVMETLLMLVKPNQDSPEASEEIALWLADEFTQRQENISLLLEFLDTNDFYSKLYSLQLLSAILGARTDKTEQCVVADPNGVPRVVAVLGDRREAIRNEAIAFLTDLTPLHMDLQKQVAFNQGFESIFSIIAEEGGLLDGGRVVEDCLILLANLLRLNSSNQSGFREMGLIVQLGRLLENTYRPDKDGEEVAPWARVQRNRNIYALLAVVRLFLVPGAVGTLQNQAAFLKNHVLENALQLAFTGGVELPIRSEAMVTCADMIRGNAKIQEMFAGLQVPSPLDGASSGEKSHVDGRAPRVFVIDGLLDIILAVHHLQAFDMRMAACNCLKAYFHNHKDVRLHFLRRAIEGHKSGADELTNVLTTLLGPLPEKASADPYGHWFAAVLMLHLLQDHTTAKALAMAVTEGDEASGEEVVTCIQTITSNLLSSVKGNHDARIITGYLMLLLCWLFEDLDGVNDFLGEFTHLPRLIQAAVENPNGDVIVQGLSAMLLGVIYEFSTKDSPVSRQKVRETIMTHMGRDLYVDKLSRLRSHPLMRDHEVLFQRVEASGIDMKLPDVFFDDTFVEFFKDNYSRVIRAIDRDPGFEISVLTNGVQKGVSRELVDSLRAQVTENERALQEAEVEKASLERQLGQEQADHRRTKESSGVEVARAEAAAMSRGAQSEAKDRTIQELENARASLTRELGQARSEIQGAKAEIARLKTLNDGLQIKHGQELASFNARMQGKETELQKQMEAVRKTAEQEAERLRRRSEAEQADVRATVSRLEVDLMKANKARGTAEEKRSDLERKLDMALADTAEVEKRLKAAEQATKNAESQIAAKEEERKSAQTELEDLLIVFGDLEEKVEKYKERLEALGETLSEEEGDEVDEVDEENDG